MLSLALIWEKVGMWTERAGTDIGHVPVLEGVSLQSLLQFLHWTSGIVIQTAGLFLGVKSG